MNEMDDVARRRAFSIWLRTGRLPRETGADGVEFKFNPWHDPENGRFTFVGTGHYYGRGSGEQAERRGRVVPQGRPAPAPKPQGPPAGRSGGGQRSSAGRDKPSTWGGGGFTGGGGGDFGGGGATGDGDWGGETKKPPARRAGGEPQRRPPVRGAERRRGRVEPPQTPSRKEPERQRAGAGSQRSSARVEVPQPRVRGGPQSGTERWRTVERNGYRYEIDGQNRTRRISGEITLNPDQRRSRTAQLAAGGNDRRKNDHGGHYIARRFNGPKEAFNHFAQDGSFNRSDYARLENQWEQAKRQKKQVRVKIVPKFEGNSQRPSELHVSFWIDGVKGGEKFPNERKRKRDAK